MNPQTNVNWAEVAQRYRQVLHIGKAGWRLLAVAMILWLVFLYNNHFNDTPAHLPATFTFCMTGLVTCVALLWRAMVRLEAGDSVEDAWVLLPLVSTIALWPMFVIGPAVAWVYLIVTSSFPNDGA